eukprot:SAG11_NODE_458_length_9290_cov_2.641388_5_plen_167_part_00
MHSTQLERSAFGSLDRQGTSRNSTAQSSQPCLHQHRPCSRRPRSQTLAGMSRRPTGCRRPSLRDRWFQQGTSSDCSTYVPLSECSVPGIPGTLLRESTKSQCKQGNQHHLARGQIQLSTGGKTSFDRRRHTEHSNIIWRMRSISHPKESTRTPRTEYILFCFDREL